MLRSLLVPLCLIVGCSTRSVAVPRTWDDERLAALEVPLVDPAASAHHLASDYYYRIPIRPIYKSYPIYHPRSAPDGYVEWLERQEPEVIWGEGVAPRLEDDADWIAAGESVFDSPLGYDGFLGMVLPIDVLDPAWYDRVGVPLARDDHGRELMPFARYVIREKGKVEVGSLSCAMCHTRVMADGTTIEGAQGNFPFDRQIALLARTGRDGSLEDLRATRHVLYGTPWQRPDASARFDAMSVEEIAVAHDAIPAGVIARIGTSPFAPVQVPDLIGLSDRKYLDHTGLVRHAGAGDLMRYAALNQLADLLNRYGDFIPGGDGFAALPDPATQSRYGDDQLYALARYAYSLQPPPNPNLPKSPAQSELVRRGREIFEREDCARCHEPPLYSNNGLTRAQGFRTPPDHPDRAAIVDEAVDTDPTLALATRRGTGFYKVPSLLGVWYRGPLEHDGSVATLEDWFDPRRTEADYVPTGWRGPPGTKTRAIAGHPFGLDLSAADRAALIAFLRTL